MLVWLLHASGGIVKLKVSELEPPKKKKNYSISIAWEVSTLLWRNYSRPVYAFCSRQLRKHYFFCQSVFCEGESYNTHLHKTRHWWDTVVSNYLFESIKKKSGRSTPTYSNCKLVTVPDWTSPSLTQFRKRF